MNALDYYVQIIALQSALRKAIHRGNGRGFLWMTQLCCDRFPIGPYIEEDPFFVLWFLANPTIYLTQIVRLRSVP